VGPSGIRVNTVSPGLIRTDALDRRLQASAEKSGTNIDAVLAQIVDGFAIPLRRPGTADEAAQLITFLVSPSASYLTGSQFVIDGGLMPTL
jgi:NAD(P)-dependent dehydrogenase (short-subunit alcohol dehydrogenase family)